MNNIPTKIQTFLQPKNPLALENLMGPVLVLIWSSMHLAAGLSAAKQLVGLDTLYRDGVNSYQLPQASSLSTTLALYSWLLYLFHLH